tara:strand:+ start:149 stop:388 length:240 start_codon:yes stop_codon:yes gene_type:complete
MEFRGKIYDTIEEWNEDNKLAQSVLEGLEGYTSKIYALSPIETIDNKFILVELKGFENELKSMDFASLKDIEVKQIEII